MRIFIDSANLDAIEDALKRGFPSGITTNPSILAKEPKTDFKKHIHKIIDLCRKYKRAIPVSVEVFAKEIDAIERQAYEFIEEFQYEQLSVKVPIGWDELTLIKKLAEKKVIVNCTCCMSFNQAIMAANAGATYVSIFSGRIRDTGYDANSVIRDVHQAFKEFQSPAQIIVGSIRQINDINEAIKAGADIVTVAPQFFKQMCSHPKTDEVVNQFVSDFNKWMS